CDADGAVWFINQKLREFVGSSADRLLEELWTGLLDAWDPGPSPKLFLCAQQARREYRFTYHARRCDGEYRLLIDCGRPRFAFDGTFLGYVGCVTDITAHDGPFGADLTERRRANADLHHSAGLVRSVFASLYGYVSAIDRGGKILIMNDAWRKFAPGFG